MAESVNCTHHIDFITNVVKFPAVCIVMLIFPVMPVGFSVEHMKFCGSISFKGSK